MRIWIVLLCGVFIVSFAPGNVQPVRGQTAACAGMTSCIYLPAVHLPDFAPYVQFGASHWVSGSSQYDFQTCYGVEAALTSRTPYTLYDIVVAARWREDTGQVLGTGSGTTVLRATHPGRPNYVTVRSPTPYPCAATPRFELVVTSLSLDRPADYRPLTMVAFRGCGSPFEGPRALVTVRNDHREPVSAIVVALQHTFGYAAAQVDGTLAPGAMRTYVPYCDDLGRGNPLSALGAEALVAPNP